MSEEISLVKGTIEIDSSKSVEATNAVVGALKEMAEQAGQTKKAISDVFKTLNNAGNRKGITGYAESMEKALEGVGESAKDAQDQIRTLNDFMKTTSKGGKFLKSKEELADVIAGSLMPQAKGFAKKEDRSGFGRTANTLAQYVNAYVAKGGTLDDSDSVLKKALKKNGFDLDTLMAISNEGNAGDKTVENLQNIYGIVDKLASTKQVDLSAIIDSSAYLKELHIIEAETTRTMDNIMAKLAGKSKGPSVQKDDIASSKTSSQRSADIKRFAKTLLNRDVPLSDDDKKLAATLLGEIEGELRAGENTSLRNQLKNKLKFKGDFEGPGTMMDFWDALRENAGDGSIDVEEAIKSIDVKYTQRKKEALDTTIAKKAKNAAEEALKSIDGLNKDQLRQMREKINGMLDESIAKEIEEAYDEKMKDFEWLTDEEIQDRWFNEHTDERGNVKAGRRNEKFDGSKGGKKTEKIGGDAAYIDYLTSRGIDPYAREGFTGDLTDEETNKRALELIKSRKTLRGLGEQASKAYAEQETEAIENLTNRLQEANDKVAELKQNAAKMLDGDGTTEEIKNIINELDNLKSALGEISKDASRAKLTDLIPGFYDIDSTKDDLLDLRSNLNKRYGEAERKQQRDANLKKAREAFQKNANLNQSMKDDASFEDIKRAINEEKTAIENLKNLQKQNGKETWKFTPEELGGDIDTKITDYTQNLYTLAAALDKVATAQEEAAAETDKAGSFYGEASDTVLSVAEQLGVTRKDKNGKPFVDVRDIDRNRGFLAGNDQAVAFLDMLEKYARRDPEKFGFKDYTVDDLKKKVSSEENVRDVQNYVDAIEKGLDQSSEEFQQIQEAYKRAVERIQKFGEGLSHFKIDDYTDPKQVLSAITDKNLGLSDYDIEKNNLLERTHSLAERRKDIGKTASDQSEENIRNRIKAYKELLPEYQALQKDLDASEFKDDFLAPKGGIKEFKYLAGEIQGLMDLIKRMEADLEKVTGEDPFKDLTDEVDNYKESLEDVAKTSETALSKKTIDSDGIKQEIEKINEALKEYIELKEKVEKSESADAVKERTGFGAIEETAKALEEQKKKLEQKLEVQQEYEKLQAQAQKLRTDRNAISTTQKDYTQAEDADEAIGKLKNLQEEYEKLKEAVVAYQKTRADAGDIASGQEFDLGKRLGVDQIDNIIKQIDTNIATLQKRADKLRGVAPEQEAPSSPGSTQSRAERTKSMASSDTKEEARAMEPLENEVRAVTRAVDEKTQAFDREATAVGANVINEVQDLEKLQKILEEIAKTTADVTQFPEGFVNQLKALGKIDIKDGVPAKIADLAEALTKLSESLNGISGEGSANITALNKLIDSAKEVREVSEAIAKVNEHNNSTPATDEEQMFRMYDRLKYAMSDYYAVIDEGVQKGYLDKDFWDKAGVTDPMAYDLNNQVPTDTGYRNKFAAAKSKARQMSHAFEESVAIYNGNNPETAYDYDSLAQGARDWARANQDALSSIEELSKAEKKRSDIERELATKVDQNKDSEYYKKLTSDLKEQEKLVEKLKTDIKKTFSDLDAEGIFPARDVDALIDETITQARTKNKGAVADIIAKYKDELRGQLDELITGYGFNKNDNRIKRLNTAIGGITDLTGKNAIEDQITGLMETKDKKAATLKKYSKEYAELNRLQLEQVKTDQAQDPQKFSEVTTAIQAQQKVVAGLAKEYKNLSTVKRDAERELAAEARNVRNKKGNFSDTVKGLKDEATRELEKIAEKHSIQRSSPEYEALLRQIESVKGKTQQSKVLAKIGTLDNQKTVEEKVDDVAKKRGLDRNGVYRSRMDALKASKVETKDELNATLDEIDKFDSEIKKRQEKGKKALSHYNEAYTNQAKLEVQAAATTQFDAGYEKLNDALDEARNKTAALRTETQSYIDVIPSIGNQMRDVESTADATYDKQEAIMNRYKKEKEAREQLNLKYKTTEYGNPNNTQAKAQRDELSRLDGVLQELDNRYISIASSAGQAASATNEMAKAKATIGKDNISKLQGKVEEYRDSANKRLAETLSSTGISSDGVYKNLINNIKSQIGNIDSASSLKDVETKIDSFKKYISGRQTKSTGLLDEYKQAMTLQSQLQTQLDTMKPGDDGFDKIKDDLKEATEQADKLRSQLQKLDDVTPDISAKLDTVDTEAKKTAQETKEKEILDQLTQAEEKRAKAQQKLASTNTETTSGAKAYAEANQEIVTQTELINKLTEAYMNLNGGTTAASNTIAQTIASAGADTKAAMAQQINRYKAQAYNELNGSSITGADFTRLSDSISNITGKTDLEKILQMIKELNKEAQKPTDQQNKLKEYVEAVKEQEKAQLKLNAINKETDPYKWDEQKRAVEELAQKVSDLGEEYVKLSYNEEVARNALNLNAQNAIDDVDLSWTGKTSATFQDEIFKYLLQFRSKYAVSDTNADYTAILGRIGSIFDASTAGGVREDIDAWARRLDEERKNREKLYSELSTSQWRDFGYLQGKIDLNGKDALNADELSRYNDYLRVLTEIEAKIGAISKDMNNLKLPEGITEGEVSKIDKFLGNIKEMNRSKDFEIKVGKNPELQAYLLQIENLRNIIPGIGPIADKAETELAELNAQFAKKGDVAGFAEKAQQVITKLSSIQTVMKPETSMEEGVAGARSLIEQRSGGTATNYKIDYSGNMATVTAEYRDQDNMIRTLSASYNELDKSISLAQTKAVQGQTAMQQFASGLKQRMMSLGQYLLTFVSFYDIINMFKQAMSTVTEFDTAFTEMRKVSDESVSSLKRFQEASFDIGKSVGTTGLQIQQSTAEFMRLGQSLQEAQESAKNANILFNVSEFESIDQATESLIAMSQAFTEVSQTEIIDSLNKIGNDFSISTSGLSEALQSSASALKTSGNDLAESLAILTAGNQVVQDPSKVGSGARTIALRLAGTDQAKAELASIGEETEGVITTVSKLRDVIMNATRVSSNSFQGFDILNDNGNYKSTYEIIQGIADIWEEIGKNDILTGNNNQNLLLEKMAGKNRSNILASMLESPEVLRNAYEEAQDAAGSAAKENEKYIDSIEGRTKALKNQLQELTTTTVRSGFIKGIVSAGTEVLKIITDIQKGIGLIGTLSIGGGTFGFIKALQSNMEAARKTVFAQASANQLNNSFAALGANYSSFGGGDAQQKGLELFTKVKTAINIGNIEYTKEQVQGFADALRSAGGDANNVAAQMLETSYSITNVGTSASQSTGLLSTMFAALKANPLTTIIAAASLAITAISGVVQHVKKQKEEAIQSASEGAAEFRKTSDNVEESISSYNKLYETMSSGNQTEREAAQTKSELLSLQQSLIDTYGAQARGIDLVNGSYDEQIAKLKEIEETSARQMLTKNKVTGSDDGNFKTAVKKMEESYWDNNIFLPLSFDSTKDSGAKVLELANRFVGKGVEITNDDLNQGLKDIVITGTAKEVNETAMDLITALQDSDFYDPDDSIISAFEEAFSGIYDETDETLKEYEEDYTSYLEAKMLTSNRRITASGKNEKIGDFYYDYMKAISDYQRAVEIGADSETVEKARAKVLELGQAWQDVSSEEGFSRYGILIEGIEEALNGATIKAYEFKHALANPGENSKGFNDAMSAIMASGASKDEMLSSYGDGNEANKGNKYYSLVADAAQAALDEGFIDEITTSTVAWLLDQFNNYMPSTYSGVEQKASSFTDFLKGAAESDSEKTITDIVDSYQTATASIEEARNKFMSQSMTDSEFVDLLQTYPELAENAKFMQEVTDNMDPSGFIRYSDGIEEAFKGLQFDKVKSEVKDLYSALGDQQKELDLMITQGVDQKVISAQEATIQRSKDFIARLVSTADFQGISADAIKSVFYDSTFSDVDKSLRKASQDQVFNLAKNGHAEAVATLLLETNTATWDYERWVSEIESKEIELKTRIDTASIQGATSQIQNALSNNSSLKGAIDSATNREFNTDSILDLINQFPLLTKNTEQWAAIIGSIDSDGLVTDIGAVSDLVSGMTFDNLSNLGMYFDTIAEKARIDSNVFDDLRKKIIDLSDLSSLSWEDIAESDAYQKLTPNMVNQLLGSGAPTEVIAKIILKGDIQPGTLEQDIRDGIAQIEHRKYQAQISVLTTYNSDMSSIIEAENEIAQGMMTPDKALSLASSLPEVAKAAEELGLTFTDMNADEILDDVDKLQVALANAKFDRLEKFLSDKNVGKAEKLSAIANADLSRNTRQTDFFAGDHVTNDWLTQRLAKADNRADKYGFENEAVYQTAVGIQMMLDSGSLANTEEAVKQAFTDLRPRVSIQLAEGSIKDIESQITQISQAASDQMSNGYITQEQLNTLKAAGVDYSKMLEVGAKGWKLNTDKVKEYEDALRDVQIAQSKSVEATAKKRIEQLDRQMKKLRDVSSETEALEQKAYNRGQAKRNQAGETITGATEYADVGGGETETRANLAARIQAGATAQDLVNEGFGFKDLASAQNYLDLSGARAELEETIQKQQQYQIATAASIDIAKQFSEASSATNDRDTAETVTSGIKAALETKNKGWWGDKNLQQYAKFFADKDTPLYQALDELESSWNNTWSKYYGSDGELSDDGVQQFLKDSAEKGLLEFYSDTVKDKDGNDYTQDWKVKGASIDELAAAWDTSKENIMTLLMEFEDTRSWSQLNWGELFGGTEEIGKSSEAMGDYIENLGLIQKYNPDMDMGQYLQTAAQGLQQLQESGGADTSTIQGYVDQLNQLAELTGQDYKVTITEDGNFDVVDTKLVKMKEHIDAIKTGIKRKEDGSGIELTDSAEQELNELVEFANGDGKELMLSWGLKPNADGEFTVEDLADQIIEFDWKLKDPLNYGNGQGYNRENDPTSSGWHELNTDTPTDPMETLNAGVDNIYGGLETANGYLAIIAGQKESEETGEESKDSTPKGMSREEQERLANQPQPLTREQHERMSNAKNTQEPGGEVHGTPRDQSKYGPNFDIEKDKYEPEKWRAHQAQEWVDGVVQKIKDGGSATIEKALEFGPQAGDAIQGWLGKYLADKYKTPRLTDSEGLATLEWPWLSEKTEGLGEWFSNSGDVVKGLGKALWEEIVYGFEGGNKPDHTDNPGVQAANNAVDAITSATLSPEDGGTNGITDPKTQENLANMGQAVADALVNLVTGHNVNASEVTEDQDTSFVETTGETGQENGQSVENVSLNAQNVQVNDDTNTPGTLANGESLTPEQRQEYSSTPETPEGEAYESESGTETGMAVINADVAELNANLPNETDPNYQQPTTYNPDPLNYGGLQGYDRTAQPDPWANVPMQTVEGTTVPGEVTASDVAITAGQATISGPVEIPNTSTDTPQTSYTPTPTSTPVTESANANVSIDADTSAIETVTSALDGITDKTVTITVNEEGVSATSQALTAIYTTAGLVDGQSPTITVKEDGVSATSASLTAIYNTAQQVEGIDPNVIVNATDNASGKLENVISAAQTAGSQTPNVTVTESGSVNAVAKLNSVKSAADQADAKDPSITVTLNTGNTIGVLQSIRNTINSLPPSKTITITTVKREVQASGTFARGTFHPAHALGTVYGYASGTIGKYWDEYSRQNSLGAYAGGRNVALGHDQDALVNEVGIESIVYYVRTYTVMCMQLFIKLRGHPKANQATT